MKSARAINEIRNNSNDEPIGKMEKLIREHDEWKKRCNQMAFETRVFGFFLDSYENNIEGIKEEYEEFRQYVIEHPEHLK